MYTIITVNHDTPRFIELCIKAVHLRTKSPYRHIVIDNGSRPDVIQMLEHFANDKWITLVRRNLNKNAGGHAASLDWILRQSQDGLICLLDSDAYPVADNWIVELHDQMKAVSAQVIGFAHFRDESLIHPSCMLFESQAYIRCGRPSFAIKPIGGVFYDTGMLVCKSMRDNGVRLLPIHKDRMSILVRHRWCGTRIEKMTGDMLDGVIPREQLERENTAWFSDPVALLTLRHK